MDFSRLPNTAFLKILEYLPLEDCVRVGRVSKIFHRIAQLAISHTKCMDLTEDRFRKLTPDQLADILDLRSSNLKRIKFGEGGRYRQLATTFANFECHRLTDIDLGSTRIDHVVFEQLNGNCPNMESLAWQKVFVGFPAITNNRLKKLRLTICDEANLRTLIGRCPNLEELILWVGNVPTAMVVLDEFFASAPRVQRIDIVLFSAESIEFETQLVNIWNLVLTSLKIKCFGGLPGDSLLHKVVTSFPHLQVLGLGEMSPTNQGIARLSVLRELQVLKLDLLGDNEPYDQGFRQLSACEKLRKLDVHWSNMTGGTLIHLLRNCSQLEYVLVWDSITEVDSPEEAVVILGSLAGIPKRDITIEFRLLQSESVWDREQTKAAIKKLEENDGLKITII